MARAARIERWGWIGACALVWGAVQAEPRAADLKAQGPAASDAAARSSTLLLDLPRLNRELRAAGTADESRPKPFANLGVSVVELPDEGVPGARSRKHHALSIVSEMPRTMLRSIGIDATECATRFRMPTKVQRDAYGSTRLDVRAQLGLACGF